MSLQTIDDSCSSEITEIEIKKIHSVLNPSIDQNILYDDLIIYYSKYNFNSIGITKFKEIYKNNCRPSKLGINRLSGTNNMKKDDVPYIIDITKKRLKYTLNIINMKKSKSNQDNLKKQGISDNSFTLKHMYLLVHLKIPINPV